MAGVHGLLQRHAAGERLRREPDELHIGLAVVVDPETVDRGGDGVDAEGRHVDDHEPERLCRMAVRGVSGVPPIRRVEAHGLRARDRVAVDVERHEVEEGVAVAFGDEHVVVVAEGRGEDEVEVGVPPAGRRAEPVVGEVVAQVEGSQHPIDGVLEPGRVTPVAVPFSIADTPVSAPGKLKLRDIVPSRLNASSTIGPVPGSMVTDTRFVSRSDTSTTPPADAFCVMSVPPCSSTTWVIGTSPEPERTVMAEATIGTCTASATPNPKSIIRSGVDGRR